MRITAITRFKHAGLYEILKRLKWTQAELARQSGVGPMQISFIINLIKRPTVAHANAIQEALGRAGEYLDVLAEWPEVFAGLGRSYKHEQTAEVPVDRLLDHPEAMQLAAPEYDDAEDELLGQVEGAITQLPKPMQRVLQERYYDGKTYGQIADGMGYSLENFRCIERRAIHKIQDKIRYNQALRDVRD